MHEDAFVAVDVRDGTSAVGGVGVSTGDSVLPVGIAAIGSIGTPLVSYNHIENVTGVAGTGSVGTVSFTGWSVINDYQDPNWVVIQVA